MPLVEGRDTVLAEEWLFSIRVELNRLEQEAQIHIPGMMEMFPQGHSLQGCNPTMEMLPQGPHTALCLGCSSLQVTGRVSQVPSQLLLPSCLPWDQGFAQPAQGCVRSHHNLLSLKGLLIFPSWNGQESRVLWQCTAQQAPLGIDNAFMFLWEYK